MKRTSASRIPAALIVVAFGPYLVPSAGLRLEHLVIYGLLPAALAVLALRRRSILAFPPLLTVFSTWLFMTVWTVAVTLVGERHFASPSTAVAYFENYLQPLAVTLVLAALVADGDSASTDETLIRVCRALVAVLCANTVVALLSNVIDMGPVMAHFTGPEATAGQGTVWERAASLGRFSGVFNQPMESGIAYSLGLLTWGYLQRRGATGWLHLGALFLLTVGGALSVSKVFLLGGFPLFLVYVIRYRAVMTLSIRVNPRFVALLGLAAFAVTHFVRTWSGFDYLMRLFRFSGGNVWDLLALYSAGRFGSSDTHVERLFAWTWRDAPLHGLGFAASPMLDNGYAEFFVQGGSVALACYLAVLGMMGWLAVSRIRTAHEESRLLLAACALVIGAGIGAPALTANRVSTVFWVLFVALCAYLDGARRLPVAGPDAAQS